MTVKEEIQSELKEAIDNLYYVANILLTTKTGIIPGFPIDKRSKLAHELVELAQQIEDKKRQLNLTLVCSE